MVENGRAAREGAPHPPEHGFARRCARPNVAFDLQPRSDGGNYEGKPAGSSRRTVGVGQTFQEARETSSIKFTLGVIYFTIIL